MVVAAGLVAALAVIAQVDAAAPGASAPAETAPAPAPPAPLETAGEPPPPPAPQAVPQPVLEAAPPRPRRYGDKGSVELGLGLTYSSEAGFAAAGSARYYVVDGVAPGLDATFVAGG